MAVSSSLEITSWNYLSSVGRLSNLCKGFLIHLGTFSFLVYSHRGGDIQGNTYDNRNVTKRSYSTERVRFAEKAIDAIGAEGRCHDSRRSVNGYIQRNINQYTTMYDVRLLFDSIGIGDDTYGFDKQ